MKEHFFGFLESSWYKKYSCTNIVTLLMYEKILICLFFSCGVPSMEPADRPLTEKEIRNGFYSFLINGQ